MRKQRHGNIIVFGTASSPYSRPYSGLLDASKASLEAWIKIISNEGSPYGIRANMISLSVVDTPNERDVFPDDDARMWLQPGDVKGIVELLCYDERTRFLNGTTLYFYNPDFVYLNERKENLRKRGAKIFE